MGFQEIIEKMGNDLFRDINMVATFQPQDGGPPVENVYVDLDQEVDLQPPGTQTEVYAPSYTIEYQLSAIGYVAERGDIFLIGPNRWVVKSIEQNDGYFVRCNVTPKGLSDDLTWNRNKRA